MALGMSPLSSRSDQIAPQRSIKLLHTDRHFHAVKRILHDEVSVDFIASPHDQIRVRLLGTREEQELHASWALKAGQSEVTAFQAFDTCRGWFSVSWGGLNWRSGIDAPRDGMNAVECAGQDEVVVRVQFLEAGSKCSVVD